MPKLDQVKFIDLTTVLDKFELVDAISTIWIEGRNTLGLEEVGNLMKEYVEASEDYETEMTLGDFIIYLACRVNK